MARDRIVQANSEDVTLALNARTTVPLLFSHPLTSLLTTALVPPPLLPRPPVPLKPSLDRSDERLQCARGAGPALGARARPRARPPLRARRHPRARQVLGRRRARRAPQEMQTPIVRCGSSAARAWA